MALQLKQSLSLAQQLIMTPQLQQAIKLLQLSRLELLETVSQEMEANPVLEEPPPEEADYEPNPEETTFSAEEAPKPEPAEASGEDRDWESYVAESNTGWTDTIYEHREAPPLETTTSSKPTLSSHLMFQLEMNRFSDTQRMIGAFIIGNLDEDGYLKATLEEIMQGTGRSEEEVLETLLLIQNFDPVGVAARDIRECLLIQVRFQNLGGTLIERIIQDYMDKLETKRYDQIAKGLCISLEDVVSAVSVITRLEPKPGRQYSEDEAIYISPDIHVFKVGDDYEISLNENGLPKLRINSYYREILNNRNTLGEEARQYIRDKLKSAAWLIKSIHQRQRTIYKVTSSIFRFQRNFLDKGISALKPLVLRDVAEDIHMHESTVSRVTTNKYVHTPQGVFELKFFFNSAIQCLDGDSISSESVKEQLRAIIKSEDKKRPYSDQEVADELRKVNIDVARRTVAKYRETIGILPSRRRRKPY